jgi:hypothetical protein
VSRNYNHRRRYGCNQLPSGFRWIGIQHVHTTPASSCISNTPYATSVMHSSLYRQKPRVHHLCCCCCQQ